MDRLYVLYDSRCGLCSRVRTWMESQPAYCEIDFVAAGSTRARALFPQLEHDDDPRELLVITDDGDVYEDDAAWIVCLWALAEFRAWSYRIARQPLRHLARRAWQLISSNRREISRMLSLKSDAEIAARLEREPRGGCDLH